MELRLTESTLDRCKRQSVESWRGMWTRGTIEDREYKAAVAAIEMLKVEVELSARREPTGVQKLFACWPEVTLFAFSVATIATMFWWMGAPWE